MSRKPLILLVLPHHQNKSLPLTLILLFILGWFRVYGLLTVQDQVFGVKEVCAPYAAVSSLREMKASVDTFVPTHIKGPFEGHALCDYGFQGKEWSEHSWRGNTWIQLSLFLPRSVSLPISLLAPFIKSFRT